MNFVKECWDDQTNHLDAEKFERLIRAHEREACAKVCEDTFYSVQAADAIRARGEMK